MSLVFLVWDGSQRVFKISGDKVCPHLFVKSHSVQTMVHDVHPAVFRGEDEEGHQGVEDVVKVVLLVDPPVSRILQTGSFVWDILALHILPVTIEEKSFEQLKRESSGDFSFQIT